MSKQILTHKQTFAAIGKLHEVELEIHRLKNALERTSWSLDKALDTIDTKKEWVYLTDVEISEIWMRHHDQYGECISADHGYERELEAMFMEKNK